MSNPKRRERTRRIVHFSAGACAFLVGPLGRAASMALAGAALLYNALLAPSLGLDRGYRRPGEGRWGGLVTYPLAVLLLLALTPAAVAAGAWAVLAAADPVAAAIGERFSNPAVPCNPDKSLTGTVAGCVVGAAACYAVLRHAGASPALPAAATAGAAGALVEALPLPGDDNLRVAGAAAIALLFWLA